MEPSTPTSKNATPTDNAAVCVLVSLDDREDMCRWSIASQLSYPAGLYPDPYGPGNTQIATIRNSAEREAVHLMRKQLSVT